jgi:outer membrane protein OmpA-like peptidoglycan-associated protein
MKYLTFISFAVFILFISTELKAQSEDAAGCKDHPLFDRIPNYRISECFTKESDIFSFPVESRIADDVKKQTKEGKYSFYSYIVKEGTRETSSLLIFRDIENELNKVSGSVIARVVEPGNSSSFITGRVNKDNMDTWILIQATGSEYRLNMIEKPRKVKIIPADEMWNTLAKKDSVALDIFFDDDTTTIIPASFPVIDQVYQMMISHPSLKLDIQCHTDNKIIRRDHKPLSAERAKIVLDAIMAKGIEKSRLTSCGWGHDKPAADNSTDEGRAKNRRVVIVKKQ